MAQTAAWLRVLALALWLGGMAAIDFIEAPLRFGSGVITRNQAVVLGQLVISRWVRVELGLGIVALVCSLITIVPRWSMWLLTLLVAILIVQAAYLAPAITHLAKAWTSCSERRGTHGMRPFATCTRSTRFWRSWC